MGIISNIRKRIDTERRKRRPRNRINKIENRGFVASIFYLLKIIFMLKYYL